MSEADLISKPAQRRYKPEETRQRILDAARAMFRAKGYANTSSADLAIAAGVAEGSIYYHYGSKRALLAELGRGFAEGMVAAMRGDSEGEQALANLDPGVMVERCFAYCDVYGDPHEMLGISGKNEADKEQFESVSRDVVIKFVEEAFEAAVKAYGNPGINVPIAAALSYAVVHDAMMRISNTEDKSATAAVIQETMRFVRAACGFPSPVFAVTPHA